MSGAPRVAARAELRKRGIKGSSLRCSRCGCCLRRWYVQCSSAVICFQPLHLLIDGRRCRPLLRARIACSAVPSACLLHSLRGGHRHLGVVVAATAELCVRPAGLRFAHSPRSRPSTKGRASVCKDSRISLICQKNACLLGCHASARHRCAEAFLSTIHSPSALRQLQAAHESCRRTVRDRSKKDSEPCLAS